MLEKDKTKVAMNEILFLCGVAECCPGCGDAPNTSEFPSKFVETRAEAEAWLEEASKGDSWSEGFKRAYIAPMYKSGSIGKRIYKEESK